MKNFQQNLLIVLALGLCGLCVYQWYGQTVQRNQIEKLNESVYAKVAAIQGYTNSIKTMDHQIAHMDAELAAQRAAAKANEQIIVVQKGDISRLQMTGEGLTNQIGEYKKAVETLEAKLKAAYAGIEKQNGALKDLVAQRDEFVKKLNDSVKDRNDVVNKYNDLVSRIEKLKPAEPKQ